MSIRKVCAWPFKLVHKIVGICLLAVLITFVIASVLGLLSIVLGGIIAVVAVVICGGGLLLLCTAIASVPRMFARAFDPEYAPTDKIKEALNRPMNKEHLH